MNVKELKEECKKNGIRGYSAWKKLVGEEMWA